MEYRMHPLQAVLIVFGVLFAFYAVALFWEKIIHHPEHVRAKRVDGHVQEADIVGASKLRPGEWQRTKVRFYGPNGEALWTQGDGFAEYGVMRQNGIYIVRQPS
jgi:hypothetical protein